MPPTFIDTSFESSDVARQNEALKGNTRSEDVVSITRKKTGTHGK